MANYFTLELDTTSPTIEVLAPNYTTQFDATEIRIVGNETLGEFQEIYIIDSQGNRRDVTFFHDGIEYIGRIYFSDYNLGILTVYARTSDDVGNLSNIASKSINLIKSENLSVEIDQFLQEMMISDDLAFGVETRQNTMEIVDETMIMEVVPKEQVQTIDDNKEVVK